MLRVNVDDLVEGEYGEGVDYRYDGEPFTGEMIEIAPNGRLIKSEIYKEGVPHGPSREWYPNGVLREVGESRKGDPIGEWREWHPNGRLAALRLFSEFGNPLGHKLWDEDGNLTYEIPPRE